MKWSTVDTTSQPPEVQVPRDYNAAADFVDRHLTEGRGGRVAVIDDRGQYTYEELAARVARAGNGLRGLGVGFESRVAMCLPDSIEFPAVFWGAMKLGAVPIPLNTLLTTADYDYMLRDSRAHTLVVGEALYETFAPLIPDQPFLKNIVVAGAARGGYPTLDELMQGASSELEAAPTTADDVGFWLYTSGSTGAPKGAMHLHGDLVHTAALYGQGVLGIAEDDVVFSAAKLFFAYGLGNAQTFPSHVGGTAVLMAERPTPESVMRRLREHNPTVFFGVPTLFGAILADRSMGPASGSSRLRACISAGEALPEGVARAWQERFGIELLDGLGSTEMLHIFLSNRPGEARFGSTGKAVPGYELALIDEDGAPLGVGEMGELTVRGPSAAVGYWNQRQKSLSTFRGPWTRTGDKYLRDEDGYFIYCGRTDDMMKVSGNWVSPFEVESALIEHHAVLEAAVVGQLDDARLLKPKAFIVPSADAVASDELADELKQFVKGKLAPYKYPRWVEFVDDLPKTATGKIKRFMLRAP